MLKFFQKQNSSSITHDKPIAVLSIAISADASNSNQTMKMQMKEMTLHYPKVICLSFLVELVNVFCILHNSQLIVHISSINIFNLLHCCCLSAEAVLFLHLFFSVRADNNHSFRLDWLHSSSLLRRRLSRHLHLQQQLHPHSQHQYISAANQEIKTPEEAAVCLHALEDNHIANIPNYPAVPSICRHVLLLYSPSKDSLNCKSAIHLR
nr:hypothetical protein Iba_chr14dCG7490 [Ipomoea batatas]